MPDRSSPSRRILIHPLALAIGIAVHWSAPSFVQADATLFAPPLSSYACGESWSVAVADLNGDGKPDLAVGCSGYVSVLLGHGDGTFEEWNSPPCGSFSAAIGDFNRDGRPDLAAAGCGEPDSLWVMLGSGDGDFELGPHSWTGGSGAFSVSIADLNGDLMPDFVATNYLENAVSVALGNGSGGFAPKLAFGTGLHPRSQAIGDVSGDGLPDLAVANDGDNSVSVLLGNGDGTFRTKVDYETGSYPRSVAIGDLNLDGKPDLAVTSAGSHSVSVLLGNGDGTFATSADYGTGDGPHSVAIGDLDQDGKPDLAVANNASTTVSVLLGNGDGTFGAKTDYPAGPTNYAVAIGDLNGDGRPDLAVANTGLGSVSVLLNTGAGVTSADRPDAPAGLSLRTHPMPARGSLQVAFDLPRATSVRLEALDVAGRSVRLLATGRLPAGSHALPWDLRGGDGVRLSNGVYFMRLLTDEGDRLTRVVVLQ